MMVIHRATRSLEHRRFSDLPEVLRAGDLLILNNTRVLPARLFARKPGTGGRAEVFLLEEVAGGEWRALLRCRRRPPVGGRLALDGGGEVELLSVGEQGEALVRFHLDGPLLDYLEAHGHVPLPPYIKRTDDGTRKTEEERDRERYQTIYARATGAVAAPTAGLHFTHEIFGQLAARGVERAEITLHVGIGTFRPVTVERVEDHVMHEERYEIPPAAADAIARARARGGRIVAVGTTSVRTLESVAARRGAVLAEQGRTDLFIYPPYSFRAVDALLTNFHLPKSTLLMMVSAFADRELILHAYAEAVRERYRFFSYGDCMLLL